MICSQCGTENKATARFCRYCGSKLELKRTCPACGSEAGENAKFCKKCGTKLTDHIPHNAGTNPGSGQNYRQQYNQQQYNQQQYSQQQQMNRQTEYYNGYSNYSQGNAGFSEYDLPVQYRPLSAWAYFGWSLLFTCVPFGWIVAIVFAVGKTGNINLRNFARSMFCFLVVIGIILLLVLGGMGCTAGMML